MFGPQRHHLSASISSEFSCHTVSTIPRKRSHWVAQSGYTLEPSMSCNNGTNGATTSRVLCAAPFCRRVAMRSRCGPMQAASGRSRQQVWICAGVQQPPREWTIASAVCRAWQTHVSKAQAAMQSAVPQAERPSLVQQLKHQCSSMAAVLPFASTTIVKASSSTQAEIYYGLAKAVDIYLAILTVRVLLSWFRNIDWFSEPWNTLRQLTDPFLQVFRGIIPPLGGIDLSPMLGFFLLNFLRGFLMNFAM